MLRTPAGHVGMDRADRWIGLSDGGNGLEDRLRENFPRVEVVILDFFHPAEKLTGLARLLHPEDEDRAEEQARRWRGLLKDEGGAVLAAVLSEWDWPRRPGLSEAVAELIGYLERHAHRMEYPEYLAKGWCIGSGAVESACKTVVGQRLKLAGMRWGEDGAHAVCHLRALYRSEKGQWEAFGAGLLPHDATDAPRDCRGRSRRICRIILWRGHVIRKMRGRKKNRLDKRRFRSARMNHGETTGSNEAHIV